MKADTIVFEEIAQALVRATSCIDEISNRINIVVSEMADDPELLLLSQADSIIASTQNAQNKISRAYSICSSLACIINSLPNRYSELEQKASNRVADLMLILEEIKTSSAVLDSPYFVFVDDLNSDDRDGSNEASERVAVSNISLTTSVVQSQLNVTRIEETDDE